MSYSKEKAIRDGIDGIVGETYRREVKRIVANYRKVTRNRFIVYMVVLIVAVVAARLWR